MKPVTRILAAVVLAVVLGAFASDEIPGVDWGAVARIREEGLQRSQVMDIAGYIVDVLGARLTNSEDMKRAQVWIKDKLAQLGLENVAVEPFMDYGVTWDEPDHMDYGRSIVRYWASGMRELPAIPFLSRYRRSSRR